MSDEQAKETDAPNKLMSIDEYLNAVDWKFQHCSERGQHGSFHWIMPQYHELFYNEVIPPPKSPYRILVTHWGRGDDNIARIYADIAGWSPIEQFAISELGTGSLPEIHNGANTTFVCLEQSVTDDDIRDALPYAGEFPRNNEWKFLEKLKPYLYVHLAGLQYYASENKELLDLLESPQVLAKVEKRRLVSEKAHRLRQWESVGAEPSSEKCGEPGCESPRIKLAALCFMHQHKKFGG